VYDANATYEENDEAGPRAGFDASGTLPKVRYLEAPRFAFLGVPLHVPFGMPAGPLLNSRFVKAALEAGVCLPVYKTVRSRAWKSHPWPNVLAIETISLHAKKELDTVHGRPFTVADYLHGSRLSISNSFGVPSKTPLAWAKDFGTLASEVPVGSHVVLSFQGTRSEEPEVAGCGPSGTFAAFVEDTCVCAVLALRAATAAGQGILEVNLSCPNEKGTPVYRDVGQSIEVLGALRQALDAQASVLGIRRPKLVAKIGVLDDAACLAFLRGARGKLDAISAINTVSARIVGAGGEVVLGAGVPSGGVCGRAIFEQGVRIVEKLSAARRALRMEPTELAIVGVGGVMGVKEYLSYRHAGADLVQSATGAMWNLTLAQDIAKAMGVPFQVVTQEMTP